MQFLDDQDALNSFAYRIRIATVKDLPALTHIYNHYIVHSQATFDTRPFSSAEREDWFTGFSDQGPYRLLVACSGDTIAGYACSHQFRHKPAYNTSVETTVYLDPGHTGQGLGRRLYRTLLDTIRAAGIHRAFAGIALPNDASIALHEGLGYRRVGVFEQVGYKFDRYWDVAWYGLALERAQRQA